jgi:hypothetical protein
MHVCLQLCEEVENRVESIQEFSSALLLLLRGELHMKSLLIVAS